MSNLLFQMAGLLEGYAKLNQMLNVNIFFLRQFCHYKSSGIKACCSCNCVISEITNIHVQSGGKVWSIVKVR